MLRLRASPQQGVQALDLIRRPDGHRYGGVRQRLVRMHRVQVAGFPDADDVYAGLLPYLGFLQGNAGQAGVMDEKLDDDEVLEPADLVRGPDPDTDPGGQGIAQARLQGQRVGGPGEAENVEGVILFGDGDDGDGLVQAADREEDVRVDRIRGVGHQQPGLVDVHGEVGLRIINHPRDRGEAVFPILGGRHRIGLENAVGNVVDLQLPHQPVGDRIHPADDDVPAYLFRKAAGRLGPYLGLQPGGVKVPDKGERQHDEKQDYPGTQHDDAEDATDVRVEGDVPESEGAHHRQRPVQAGQPGVLLVLENLHQDMEQHRVQDDDSEQEVQVGPEGAQVPLGLGITEKIGKLGNEELHLDVRARPAR